MKIAIVQSKPSTDKSDNLSKALDYIKEAQEEKVDFIVFPEVFMVHVTNSGNVTRADVAETVEGDFVKELAWAAKKNQMYVMCGMYEAKDGESYRAYNTVVLINKEGKVVHKQRKTHLYDAFTVKESDRIIRGSNPFEVVETEFGKVGIMICYELRFPEVARELTLQGADILIVPTAWASGNMKEHHWQTLLQARAIENTIYVAGVDQVGNNNVGNSMIIDPMGFISAGIAEEEGMRFAKINLDRQKRVRDKLPSIKHRRPELYVHQ